MLLSLGGACFCTWERKGISGSKNLLGYQLQWAVALLQVNLQKEMHLPYVWKMWDNVHWWWFFSGPSHSPWCTAMRWYQRALFVSFTLTWSSTSPQTKELMEELWCLHLSRYYSHLHLWCILLCFVQAFPVFFHSFSSNFKLQGTAAIRGCQILLNGESLFFISGVLNLL